MAFANRLNCYVCDQRFRPQLMNRIYNINLENIRQIAIARQDNFQRIPMNIEHNTRLCRNCYQNILREIRLIEKIQ